jgi:hypothetical protein
VNVRLYVLVAERDRQRRAQRSRQLRRGVADFDGAADVAERAAAADGVGRRDRGPTWGRFLL